MPAGRPPLFESPEELQKAIDAYFEWCKGDLSDVMSTETNQWTREPEPLTITGLALYLGFESRQSLYDYEKNSEYSYIVKRARLTVENGYEKRLLSDKPVGSIFALKNMGWADRQEIKHEGIPDPNITVNIAKSSDE